MECGAVQRAGYSERLAGGHGLPRSWRAAAIGCAMQPHAYLVNVARGRVIDEQSLIRALREGWIAGAGLDVTEEEPLSAESPLYTMPNVILTPHISGVSIKYDERLTDLFADNLRRFRQGEPLLNRYEASRGY